METLTLAVHQPIAMFVDTDIADLAIKALTVGMKVGAPILIAATLTGLILALLAAVFQVQDQTITMVPKYFVVALVLAFFGTWMLHELVDFTRQLYTSIPDLLKR